MYMEASSPNKMGYQARLYTKTLNTSSSYICLSFWYHMKGVNIGLLTIYVVKDDKTSIAWTKSGKHRLVNDTSVCH